MIQAMVPFTRSGLDFYRRWLGINESSRENLQRTYPTAEAAIEAMEYGNYEARRQAIRVLWALDEHDKVLSYALAERDSSWIPMLACEMLVQPHLELMVSWITRLKPSGDGSHFSSVIALQLPRLNLAHIGEPLIAFLAKQKRRLAGMTSRHLDALGYSALGSAVPLLNPYMGVESLRTFRQALDAGMARKACKPSDLGDYPGPEERTLDRDSSCAIAAACALRRLGQRVDSSLVSSWLQQLDRLFRDDQESHSYQSSVQALRWVLFDQGDDSQFDWFSDRFVAHVGHDVAWTVLRRGETERFEQRLSAVPEKYPTLVHPPCHVHFWPLIDHLQSRGIRRETAKTDHHLLARAANVPAPHGWAWQCEPEDI
jgi:hypothetical protein